ncbi:MAG: hypothetical protein IKP64_03640 [Selenomonadaceae bacterium]|nr:hypothetical protein [Selenomonadaceae bacterium]MBR4382631.1 hypothetical protein [Selenomonadaceae bacterium]
MIDKLTKWAQAGDEHAMYKLAGILLSKGNLLQYEQWLKKSAEAKHFDAMKEYAKLLRDHSRFAAALEIYKELTKTFRDTESMEAVVDMCEQSQGVPKNDGDTLNFVLEIIDGMYNEIYLINRGHILLRTLTFDTRRHNECTMRYLEALERRRIAARIRKILSAEEN